MENLNLWLNTLHVLGKLINNSLAFEEVLEFASDALVEMLGASHLALFLVDGDHTLALKSAKGFPMQPYALTSLECLVGRAAASHLSLTYDELSPEEATRLAPGLPFEEVRSAMIVSMLVANRLMGVVMVGQTRPRAFDASQMTLLDIVAMHVANAAQSAMLLETAKQQTITDGMTNLYNHRFFQEELRRLAFAHQRYNRVFSLLMIDLDHFKAVNDRYGPPVGDEMIRKVAELILGELRITDIVTRYGGDEIAVLLTETPYESAIMVAERLVEKIAHSPFVISDDLAIGLTISLGIASFPEHAAHPSELIAQADRSLYHAKHSGRNQVGRL